MNIVFYILKVLIAKAKVFEESTRDPMKVQEKCLFEYLSRNRNTLYGKEHDFTAIRSIREYQERVPISTYETLKPYIERMKAGEKNVLTLDSPILFGITSGTTDRQKFIPVTKYSRFKKSDTMDLWIYYLSRDNPDMFDGKVLVIVSPEVEGYTESGIPYGAETGHGYRNMPSVVKALYAVPYEVFTIKDYDAKYYCILRLAMEKNLTTIAAFNPSTLVLLCQKIKKIQDDIIEDIRNGTIKKDLNLPDSIREILEEPLRPNPERAQELSNILEAKKDLLPKYVWPNIKSIECWKGGTVSVYLKDLATYFGDLPIRDFGYLASELRGSIPVTNNGAEGILAISGNFYEFIPREDFEKKKKRILLCNQLEKGKEYFVVVTTPGGLYRYNIDDIVRVTGFANKTPLIEFVSRGFSTTSITGEKLHESHVVQAVKKATEEHKVSLKFFTACVQSGKTYCYTFVAEFEGRIPKKKKKEFLKTIDKELCVANVEYESKRKSQRLCHPTLKVTKQGEFEKYRKKRVKEGVHDGQFKVLTLTPTIDFHKQFAIEENISVEK